MWCSAHPKIGEREVLAAPLEHNHHLIRTGQILLSDKGFAGKHFKQLTDAMGLHLLRRTARTRTTPTATSTACASGSSWPAKPSKSNSISKATAHATSKRSLIAFDH
jgi:hypothetical protein